LRARVATPADAAALGELFALAFYDDPAWSWGFPDEQRRLQQHTIWWGMFVNSALPHRWVWLTEGRGAASLWIPPGAPELSEADEARSEPLLRELIGDWADRVLEFTALFDQHRPAEPHYYLSLLATHPDHRGRGEGMGLLDHNLGLIDAQGGAAYLESTNPGNDRLYERRGFVRVGEFSAPGGGPVVACMWRAAR
jgi:GNAT superfamily N-acetyltransferase